MANSAVIGLLRVLLSANSAEFEGAMKRSADSAKAWSKDLKAVGSQAQSVGAALTSTLTLPIVGLGAASVKAFASFDAAMTKSEAIMGDLSDAMRSGLEATARDVGKTTTFSATQAAQAYEFLASAGLTAAQSMSALPVVAKFAQAGALDLADATSFLANAQSALGLRSQDAATNMQNMSRVSDVLTKANILADGSVRQFAEALTNKAAAALRLVHKDVEEGAAVLAVYADQGTKGAEAGEKLNIVLRDLQTAAVKHGGAFKELGVSVYDSAGNMRGMAAIVGDLEKALAGMSDQQRKATIMTLGFQDRSVSALNSLIGFSGAIRNYETQLRSAAGVTDDVANRQLKSFAAQMDLLWGRVSDVGITIGKALVPALTAGAGALASVLPLVETLANAFGALPVSLQIVATGFAGMVAAAGPALYLAGSLTRAAGDLAGAFAKNGIAMRFLVTDLAFLGTALQGNIVSAAATVTTYGAMGAASIGLTTATRALGAAIMAMPWAAATAGAALLAEGLVYLYGRSKDADLALATAGQKQLTINKALAAGAASNAAYAAATDKYAAAVEYNNQVEAARAATFDKSLAAQKRGIEAALALGQITQQQANDQLAAIAVEQQAADVRSKRVTLNESLANTEKKVRLEIAATGESQQALVTAMTQDRAAFANYAKEVGLSTDTLRYLEAQVKTTTKETHAAATAAEKYAALLREVAEASAPLTVLQQAQARSLDALGVSTAKIADYLGVTDEQVARFKDSLKATASTIAEIGRQISGIPHNVQLRLSTTGLSGAVPMIDVKAVQAASGAVKQISDATWGDIEGRMHAAGVFTRDELVKMATAAREQYTSMLVSGKFTASELQAAWKRMVDANDAAQDGWAASFHRILETIPQTLASALTGGGGVAGAMKAIGSTVGTEFGTRAFGPKGFLKGIGDAIPGIGPAIGSLLGPALGALVNLFGSAGRDAVKAFSKKLTGSDDLNALHAELTKKLGPAAEQFWILLSQGTGRGNAAQAAANIKIVEDAIAAADKKAADFNAAIHGMLSDVQTLGSGLPDSLRSYLSALEQGGRLTQDNLDLVHQLAGQGAVDWHAIEAAVSRYGGEISKLGGSFQDARLHDSWQQVIDDMALFEKGGISAGDALQLTKGKIQELVQQSAAFGTEIPANMKPWIQHLIDAGDLLDASGEKITSLDKLTFGETLQTSLEKLTDAIQLLVDQFNKIPGAIAAIPRNVDIDVNVRKRDGSTDVDIPSYGAGGFVSSPHMAIVGDSPEYIVPTSSIGALARSLGQYMPALPDLSALSVAGLGNISVSDLMPSMDAWRGDARISPGSGSKDSGTTTVNVVIDGRALARAVVPHIPGHLSVLGVR